MIAPNLFGRLKIIIKNQPIKIGGYRNKVMRVYLDNAATTPIAPEVIEIITQVMQETHGNPSSIHREGRTARSLIEKARKTCLLYTSPSPRDRG